MLIVACGPVLGLLAYLLLPDAYPGVRGEPITLGLEARATAALAVWMATWWLTEAIPVYATALLPLAVLPLTGAATIKQVAAPYGHEVIFLFLGGFILALAIERWELHRRLALAVLGRIGTRPTRIVGGFMAIAAFTSMWVTNTATTIMLLPVALSVIRLVSEEESGDGQPDNFAVCLLLSIAYAASIGGIATIVGTAPNAFVVGFIENEFGREISFVRWMAFGVPVTLTFLPLAWWLLARKIYPVDRSPREQVAREMSRLHRASGPLDSAQKRTLLVAVLTATAWILRPVLNELTIGGFNPLAGLTDPGIAVISALALFVIPCGTRRKVFLMDWTHAVRLPWGLLILFGGGLSLAAALASTGVSDYLGSRAVGLGALPAPLIIGLVTASMIFLTELTSNTATTATVVPILAALSASLGLEPLLLVVPAAIAASCAFMLPVATPPNAIVFGSGLVTIPQMSRAGLWLNIAGIILVTLMVYMVMVPVLGITA
jgi:sodium-dependent dicarboxylate transporter 2/3/5